jgi:hypothetical protein
MTEFGKRGVELLREICNFDGHSLPSYNVRTSTTPWPVAWTWKAAVQAPQALAA